MHDVTARRNAEARVLVSEIRYRRLFEAAHDGVLIVDPETRKIVDANPYMSELLGYPHGEIVGKELYEIGLLRDEDASREMFRELKRATRVRYDDLPLKSLSGLPREVEVVANLYDENGRPVIQCNIRDITARKHAEGHVRLLIAEVNHRANNLLAIVQAVAFQAGQHGDPATLAQSICARPDAISLMAVAILVATSPRLSVSHSVSSRTAGSAALTNSEPMASRSPFSESPTSSGETSTSTCFGMRSALHITGTIRRTTRTRPPTTAPFGRPTGTSGTITRISPSGTA
jgi:PAS domain S-box-containing protein